MIGARSQPRACAARAASARGSASWAASEAARRDTASDSRSRALCRVRVRSRDRDARGGCDVSARATHDASRAADAAARLAAQTVFGVPLVLVAGAGTGKTTVLVARVLAWCLGPGWDRAERALLASDPATPARRAIAERTLDRVVAITFTEAAAAEMEARAMKALAQVAAGAAVVGPRRRGRDGRGGGTRRERARVLLAAFDRLHVQTIHAFCRRLLANHPLEAGLHPRFTVDARGAARARRYAKRSKRGCARWRSTATPISRRCCCTESARRSSQRCSTRCSPRPCRSARSRPIRSRPSACRRIRGAAARGVGCAERGARRAHGRRSRRGRSRNQIAVAALATSARLTRGAALARGTRRTARRISSAPWPKNVRNRLREWGRGEWTAKAEQQAVLGAAGAVEAARARSTRCSTMRSRSTWRCSRSCTARSRRCSYRQRGSCTKIGAESFDALLRKTRDLLVERPDVAERVRRDIDQLLVDEFQDTDALQCEIVAALALEGDAADAPGTLPRRRPEAVGLRLAQRRHRRVHGLRRARAAPSRAPSATGSASTTARCRRCSTRWRA